GTGDKFEGWASFPSPIPPWSATWCEFNLPMKATIGDRTVTYPYRSPHMGAYFECIDRNHDTPGVNPRWIVFAALYSAEAAEVFIGATSIPILRDGTVGISDNSPATVFMPNVEIARCQARIDRDRDRYTSKELDEYDPTDVIFLPLKTCLLAFSLANCRNVTVDERIIPRAL